jgi:hypothetical protein
MRSQDNLGASGMLVQEISHVVYFAYTSLLATTNDLVLLPMDRGGGAYHG